MDFDFITNIVRMWFTDPVFIPIINFFTILILAITAYEGFRSIRLTSESNELSIFPLLVVKFIGKPLNNRSIIIKNIGNGTAYDIKIEKYIFLITDAQQTWEMYLKLPGVNVLERGEKRNLHVLGLENGKESSIKDLLIFHLDPEEEHDRKTVRLFITFRNAKGVKYYSRIETGKDGLNFVIPPKKMNLRGYLIIQNANISTYLYMQFYKLIWKFRKPYIAQPRRKQLY